MSVLKIHASLVARFIGYSQSSGFIFLHLEAMKDKARKLIEKYEELESELGNPDVLGDQTRYNKIHKQYKGIEKAVIKAKEYLQMLNDQDEWKLALGDSDPEMVAMAKSELATIEKALPALTDELQILMVPKDPWDFRNATFEIRA